MLYVEFRCHIVCFMLTRVGGEKCSGGQGHVVCGCRNVCMCLAFHSMLFVVLCACWYRLCCMLSSGAT